MHKLTFKNANTASLPARGCSAHVTAVFFHVYSDSYPPIT